MEPKLAFDTLMTPHLNHQLGQSAQQLQRPTGVELSGKWHEKTSQGRDSMIATSCCKELRNAEKSQCRILCQVLTSILFLLAS